MSKGKKITISYSDFSSYLSCGHKYLLENVLRLVESTYSIHALFGTAIHEALGSGIKDGLSSEEMINLFRYRFKKDMMDHMSDSFEFYSLDEFTKQGEHILKFFSTKEILDKYEIIGIEQGLFDKIYKNYNFVGYIDLVVRDKKTGRYVIIDWKTSTAPWNLERKMEDKIFLSQMVFYKYFYARKNNIPIDLIDCRYVVLNRLKDKERPNDGYGELQVVEVQSTLEQIEEMLDELGKVARGIYIRKEFTKAKLENKEGYCYFCPFKDGHKMCNSKPDQYEKILRENLN